MTEGSNDKEVTGIAMLNDSTLNFNSNSLGEAIVELGHSIIVINENVIIENNNNVKTTIKFKGIERNNDIKKN